VRVLRGATETMTDTTVNERRWSTAGYVTVVAFAAAFVAVIALRFVTATGEVGPGRVQIGTHWSRNGNTEIQFPPLGSIGAPTHWVPIAVTARAEQLDVEQVERLVERPEPQEALRTEVERDIPPLVRTYAIRAVLVAIGVGAVVGALPSRRRIVSALVGAGAAGLVVTGLLAWTWSRFDPRAFEEPSFEGALERAPAVIEAVQRHVDDVSDIRDRVDILGDQIAALYSVALEGPAIDDDTVRILHVSDIHSNPLGIEIVRDLAEELDVAAVLDTGDLTSFGSPVEARIGDLIADIPRPYLFVPGNHDSPGNRAALGTVPNIVVLDGTTIDVEGVEILGVADPTFTATNEIDDDEAGAIKADYTDDVARMVRREKPDVLAVHDERIAEDAIGSVPLVVSGHVHETTLHEADGTLVLTVGSTGATGLGAFTIDDDRAYEAEVLHFVDGELRIVDSFSLRGLSGSYTVERRVVERSGDGK
jgi:predicted phosphodiesterase